MNFYSKLFLILLLFFQNNNSYAVKKIDNKSNLVCTSLFKTSRNSNEIYAPTKDLLRWLITLRGGGKISDFSPKVKKQIKLFLEQNFIYELTTENLDRAIISLYKNIANIEADQSELKTWIGNQIASLRIGMASHEADPMDSHDFQRGWGFRLLRESDPIFSDPNYLAEMLSSTSLWGTHFIRRRGKFDLDEKYFKEFNQLWRSVAPYKSEIARFTISGSEANNSLFLFADKAVQKRFQKITQIKSEILALGNTYIATDSSVRNRFNIFPEFSEITTSELDLSDRPLTFLEQEKLDSLRSIFSDSKRQVGGILLEIVYSRTIKMFSRSFLISLRNLCDEYGVLIFDDEVLSGGGRTGKFFAYEHIQGFEPDFVTFGKGLVVSGVLATRRIIESNYSIVNAGALHQTTVTNHNEVILKSSLILRRIQEGHLMENAFNTGNYLKEKYGFTGLGLMLSTQSVMNSPRKPNLVNVASVYNRLLPYLDLTPEEADQIFE